MTDVKMLMTETIIFVEATPQERQKLFNQYAIQKNSQGKYQWEPILNVKSDQKDEKKYKLDNNQVEIHLTWFKSTNPKHQPIMALNYARIENQVVGFYHALGKYSDQEAMEQAVYDMMDSHLITLNGHSEWRISGVFAANEFKTLLDKLCPTLSNSKS